MFLIYLWFSLLMEHYNRFQLISYQSGLLLMTAIMWRQEQESTGEGNEKVLGVRHKMAKKIWTQSKLRKYTCVFFNKHDNAPSSIKVGETKSTSKSENNVLEVVSNLVSNVIKNK